MWLHRSGLTSEQGARGVSNAKRAFAVVKTWGDDVGVARGDKVAMAVGEAGKKVQCQECCAAHHN